MLNSSLIGKIQKSLIYAAERDRVSLSQFTATFRGDHDTYTIAYQQGVWKCTCHFFEGHGLCSHSLALQRMLEGMMPHRAAPASHQSLTPS